MTARYAFVPDDHAYRCVCVCCLLTTCSPRARCSSSLFTPPTKGRVTVSSSRRYLGASNAPGLGVIAKPLARSVDPFLFFFTASKPRLLCESDGCVRLRRAPTPQRRTPVERAVRLDYSCRQVCARTPRATTRRLLMVMEKETYTIKNIPTNIEWLYLQVLVTLK